MRFTPLLLVVLLFYSCQTEKKADINKHNIVKERPELSQDSKIFLGNRLFSEKTCITCHDRATYKKAPSVVEIMTVYKKEKADIVAFLKGKSKPIVETDSSQIAIMQDNINGFLKQITDVELDAIATYMLHVDTLMKK